MTLEMPGKFAEGNLCVTRRSRSTGVTRRRMPCEHYGEREKPDLALMDLASDSGPTGDDEISWGVDDFRAGVQVHIRYVGDERRGPEIARAWRDDSGDKGTVFWMSHAGAEVVFLFDKNVDQARADAAHRGACAVVKAWLQRSRLFPREYRPGLWSPGFLVDEENAPFRPCARARVDGQSYPTEILCSGVLYRAGELARTTEGEHVR